MGVNPDKALETAETIDDGGVGGCFSNFKFIDNSTIIKYG